MSVCEILSASTTRAIASPGVGTQSALGKKHAYAVRSLETDAWARYSQEFRGVRNVWEWTWVVRLEDATVFHNQADARLAAQTWFPLDRTEVVRVNLPLQSPVNRSEGSECSEGRVPPAVSFSDN